MVYLIGGPPRCGKSVLAHRLTRDHNVPVIPTDLIWAVLEVGQPEWRLPMPKGPDRIPRAAAMFEPYLERAVAFLQPVRQPYAIEGEVITPETATRLRSTFDLRVVFLIRSTATADDIADSRGPNPWLAAAAPYVVSSVTAEVLSWSKHVQAACRELGIPYFDVADGFERALGGAANALIADARPI